MKKIKIITSLFLLIFLFSACTSKTTTNTNQSQKTGNLSQINSNTKESDKKEWQGVITEDDGWKKYVNDYYGVKFRFRDEDGLNFKDNNKGDIQIGKNCTKEKSFCANNPMYIEISFGEYEKNIYKNLKSYLEQNWQYFWQTNATSYDLENINNENNINVYKLTTDLNVGYYSECKEDWKKEDKDDIYKDFISIQCRNLNDICQDIILSLNILD